ncbi:membrane fusion protein (multidrug efflux system) [Panacagrimonas perspica]|uniref:Membrane fusion protein (Multidrug efflux system) n=1 Tax=Panacagrimonas perspica TaxID=381431 RepID=A0A4V3F6E6_9GAMM|nr:efflux RND transporter periplasmic adaptor subunit [Panacagrimonas perspica]TDU32176.1 membrane fusion protein (multidrug efflux system) [Panacagrimonas perspica]THD01125.1 efflux transporter periplasmic adaptor subunit [Panacagrimonas perspica]
MNNAGRLSLALRASSLVLAVALAACGRTEAEAAPAAPPKVSVVTVGTQSVAVTAELPGRVTAMRTAEVRPQVNGIVQKRFFTEGGEVKAGQQLYQIDPAPYEAQLQAAIDIAAGRQRHAERVERLYQQEVISGSAYDEGRLGHIQAQEALKLARINLVYTKVLSPISGRIGRSAISEGALVTAGQPGALAVVQQIDPIYVDVTQPSRVLLRLKRELSDGHLKQGEDGGARVKLALEDGNEYPHAGTMQFSELTVDEGTGSVTLRAVFPNPDGVLLPGMFVHGIIEEGVRPDAILVPQLGITHDRKGEPTALVVSAGNKVEMRQLVTDRAVGDQWLVSKGLAAGDRVIVEGLQYVKPGDAVDVSEYKPGKVAPAPGATPAEAAAAPAPRSDAPQS